VNILNRGQYVPFRSDSDFNRKIARVSTENENENGHKEKKRKIRHKRNHSSPSKLEMAENQEFKQIPFTGMNTTPMRLTNRDDMTTPKVSTFNHFSALEELPSSSTSGFDPEQKCLDE
jgi:hypothetical protein